MTVIPEVRAEEAVPSPQEVYDILIAFRDRDGYKEGTVWTNETHPNYKWNASTSSADIPRPQWTLPFTFPSATTTPALFT